MSNPFKKKNGYKHPVAAVLGGLSSQVIGGLVGAAVMTSVGEPTFAWLFEAYALLALSLIVVILSVRAIASYKQRLSNTQSNHE